MAANPVVVTKNITITYDGVKVPLLRGQVIDMPVGGTLANAPVVGGGTLSANVANMTAQQVTPGGSDSVNPAALATQQAGGGVDPYNAGQAG